MYITYIIFPQVRRAPVPGRGHADQLRVRLPGAGGGRGGLVLPHHRALHTGARGGERLEMGVDAN